jgi:hypothetical protein
MMDWKLAQCATEIGVTWFRRHDADAYPHAYIGAAKWYQDEMLAAVRGLVGTTHDSDMSVTAEALDEHWHTIEWSRTEDAS